MGFINDKWMKKIIGAMFVIAVLVLAYSVIQAAGIAQMKWLKSDTMDTNFTVIENKAGDEELLLELNVEDAGEYDLFYYLEDRRQTKLHFEKSVDTMKVYFSVFEKDEADPSQITNITQDLIEKSYEEVDYSLAVPEWKTRDELDVTTSGAIEFSISSSASSQYPGVAFKVNNKRLLVKWDFQQNLAYVLIDNYESGKMMPIEFVTPEKGTEEIFALKQLEDFDIVPTHLKKNDAGDANYELAPVILPNDVRDIPGNKPGLKITFKQPKEHDDNTWQYDYITGSLGDITGVFELKDIGTGDYFNFTFPLNTSSPDETDQVIGGLAPKYVSDNAGVKYNFENNVYTINIVEDKSELADATKEKILQWSNSDGGGLKSSSLYNALFEIQVEDTAVGFDDHQFTEYQPINKFAYTFMAYILERSSVEEAHLNITPYQAGEQDEVEYTILYSKTRKDQLEDEDLWQTAYHTSADGNDEIFIPIPFQSASTQDYYQVIITFSGTPIRSQVIEYNAANANNVPPTTPGVQPLENLFVAASLEESDVPPQEQDPKRVVFDMIWDAPTNDDIKELDQIFLDNLGNVKADSQLYYEILANDVPTDYDTNPFEVIKVYKMVVEDGEYRLKAHPDSFSATPDLNENLPSGYNQYGYNKDDELLRWNEITVYDEDLYGTDNGWAKVLEPTITYGTNGADDTYTIEVKKEPVSNKDVHYDFDFPGVNFLRVRVVKIVDGDLTQALSVSESLPLSMITYDVPVVDEMSYEPLYGSESERTNGATFKWHTVNAKNYVNYMLSPLTYDLEDVVYNVYIGEKKESLLALDTKLSEDVSKELAMTNPSLVEVSDSDIKTLRDGEIMFFSLSHSEVITDASGEVENVNKNLAVQIEGLDANRNYYIRVVTEFQIDDTDSDIPDLIWGKKYSKASSTLGVTVPKVPGTPDDSEVVPLAPENMEVVPHDKKVKLMADVKWSLPVEMSFEENGNGFEVIAIEDRSLPSDLLTNGTTLESILGASDLATNVVEGWRIYMVGNTARLEKYVKDSTTGVYSWIAEDLSYLTIDDNKMDFVLFDSTNAPNKVNYYYVRTLNVETVEDANRTGVNDIIVKSYSPWVADSFTTDPVKGPINLVIDYESDYTKEAAFDPKTNFIIRFDAPISDVLDVGTNYIMEIHVKGEDDAQYSMTKYNTVFLGNDPAYDSEGYERLYYRIEELKPGKTYNIKIRIIDQTKEKELLYDGSYVYPKSAYSDIVTSRTEFDQESYDKENKYYEYIDYYKRRAEELKQVLYFEVTDYTNEVAIKYRENYSEGIIKRTSNSEWHLYSANKPINTYYIPSESLEAINDNGVTLVVESKDQQVGIRPNTLGVRLTNEIDDLLEEIAQYTSDYNDYYLKIRVFTDTYDGKINNETPTSELVEVEFSVVRSKKIEEVVDGLMVATLDDVIENYKSVLITRIEEELKLGINDDKLLQIVEEVVADVKKDYMVKATNVFNGEINDQVTAIQKVNKAIYLALEPDISPANNVAYTKQNGLWKKVESAYFNDKYFIDTTRLDSFVLIPSLSTKTDLVEVYSQPGVDVINQYQLATIFSSYEMDSSEQPINKYQWISALARLAGATAGSDTADYLKDRDVKVNTLNNYKPITYEEALDFYVKTYAFRHGIDLDSVYISNYNVVEDMALVSDQYYDTIVQGANLGIVPTKNGVINPQHEMTVKESIELLTILDKGLN